MPGGRVIDTETLFAPLLGRRGIGLAVSGGADSFALLLLVQRWRIAHPEAPPIHVYSVDHGLRPEAADEVKFVLAEARQRGFAARGLRWEGHKPETGLQAAARAARYGLLRAAMTADGLDLLLTAHHQADQAETVLMRLAHGSGVEGLRGMDAFADVEGCVVYRPLLGVAPGALREIVERAGLVAVEDPSNTDPAYERVRWRRMLPELEALGLDGNRLATFARRMADADQVIAYETEAAYGRLVRRGDADVLELSLAAYAALPRAIAIRLLGRVLAGVGGNRRPHALAALETLSDRLATRSALKRTTLHGCLIASDGVTIVVSREIGRRSAPALVASVGET